ncbi:hypothetical protein [Rubinisphaera sp. JC750]|uniref:hypothetical protein n=1 Tax=Rubinisphaera sp. JC750 TaxID=2898658 RepID=UPI001F2645F0|nr:hypothetical protein [Rubinisphaera sp. JC750]
MKQQLTDSKSVLILGHPGHELRVLGWMKAAKPWVIVLTDGSGHTSEPRIGLTRDLIDEAGAQPAELLGTFTDEQIYKAILDQDFAFFRQIRNDIAAFLAVKEIEVVVGDAIEGYNPSHDLCRCLIEGAVAEFQQTTGTTPLNYEFPLVGHPAVWSDHPGSECYRLNDADERWKRERIFEYARTVGGTLLTEVESFLEEFGPNALVEEWLTASQSAASLAQYKQTQPYYETHGQKQVEAGYYQQAILFNEHILPVITALGMDLA